MIHKGVFSWLHGYGMGVVRLTCNVDMLTYSVDSFNQVASILHSFPASDTVDDRRGCRDTTL